jgi:plasmid maintenance system antidote protein VapI
MARKKSADRTGGLVEQLREIVRGMDRTLTELAALTGVEPSRMSRFLRGERGLGQDALDRIVKALDLRIVRGPMTPRPRKKGKQE